MYQSKAYQSLPCRRARQTAAGPGLQSHFWTTQPVRLTGRPMRLRVVPPSAAPPGLNSSDFLSGGSAALHHRLPSVIPSGTIGSGLRSGRLRAPVRKRPGAIRKRLLAIGPALLRWFCPGNRIGSQGLSDSIAAGYQFLGFDPVVHLQVTADRQAAGPRQRFDAYTLNP